MGARAAGSPREVASQVDVLITMLPNSPDVEAVVYGANGIEAGARRNLLDRHRPQDLEPPQGHPITAGDRLVIYVPADAASELQ